MSREKGPTLTGWSTRLLRASTETDAAAAAGTGAAARMHRIAGEYIQRMITAAYHQANRMVPIVQQATRSRTRQHRQQTELALDALRTVVDVCERNPNENDYQCVLPACGLTRNDDLHHVDLQLENVPLHVLHEHLPRQRPIAQIREERREALRQRKRHRIHGQRVAFEYQEQRALVTVGQLVAVSPMMVAKDELIAVQHFDMQCGGGYNNTYIRLKPRNGSTRASMPPARQTNTHSERDNSS